MTLTRLIKAGTLLAEVVPSMGGGIARLDHGDFPLFRQWKPTTGPFELASIVLVPWSNRVSRPGFVFDGRTHDLPVNDAGGLPLHGNGFQSAWDTIDHQDDSIRLRLASAGPGPYRYEAELQYALTASGLRMAMTVTNRAAIDLPYGVGFHPWITRTPKTKLCAGFSHVWLERPDHLPERLIGITDAPAWDFAEARELPLTWINNAFRWTSADAEVHWPERGLGLRIERSAPLDWAVIYSPGQPAGFFCFEPVSHPVDAFWLPGGAEANGLSRLAPGQSLTVWCSFGIFNLRGSRTVPPVIRS